MTVIQMSETLAPGTPVEVRMPADHDPHQLGTVIFASRGDVLVDLGGRRKRVPISSIRPAREANIRRALDAMAKGSDGAGLGNDWITRTDSGGFLFSPSAFRALISIIARGLEDGAA